MKQFLFRSPCGYAYPWILCCLLLLPLVSLAQLQRDWAKVFPEDGVPVAMSADAQGNMLVKDDWDLIKISPEGEVLWRNPVFWQNGGFALDSSGNAYVYTDLALGRTHGMVVTKFSADGEKLWQGQYAVSSTVELYGAGIVVHPEAGVSYVLVELREDGQSRYEIWQHNTKGMVEWVAPVPNFSSVELEAHSMVLNKAGDIYLFASGEEGEESAEGLKPFLYKYSGATGELLWQKDFRPELNDPSPYDYHPRKLLIDSNENLLLIGKKMMLAGPYYNTFIFKTDLNGELLWNQSLSERRIDVLDAVLGPNDALTLLSGVQSLTDGRLYPFLHRLDSGGDILWTSSLLPGNETIPDSLQNIHLVRLATLPQGSVAAVGSVTKGSAAVAAMVVAFDAQGNIILKDAYEAHADHDAKAAFAAYSEATQSLYIAGGAYLSGTWEGSLLAMRYKYIYPGEAIPVEVTLSLPPGAVKVGEQVRATATFADYTMEQHEQVQWLWGDGSAPSESYTEFGSPRITGQHHYQQAGIYRISLNFSQSRLMPTSEDYTQWMPVFDPEAGAVRATGVIASPRSPLPLMQQAGSASFAFSAAYTNNRSEASPRGSFFLRLPNRDTFRSTSLQWLIVQGQQAVVRGVGTLNGSGSYSFILSVSDTGEEDSRQPSDRLRLRIWNTANANDLLYDNYLSGGDILDLQQEQPILYAGQVVILRSNLRQSAEAMEVRLFVSLSHTAGMARLAVELPQGGRYSLSVVDGQGQVVYQVLEQEAQNSGLAQHIVDLRAKGRGLYIAKLQTQDGGRTVKLWVD